jgi:hypothetical protein
MPTTDGSWQAREASSPFAYTADLGCRPQSPVDPTTSATLTQSTRKAVTSGIATAPLRGESSLLPSAEGCGDTVKPLKELPCEDASRSLGVTPAEITSLAYAPTRGSTQQSCEAASGTKQEHTPLAWNHTSENELPGYALSKRFPSRATYVPFTSGSTP